MTGQSHGDPLRHASPDQVAHATPAEIVRNVAGLDSVDSDLAVLPCLRHGGLLVRINEGAGQGVDAAEAVTNAATHMEGHTSSRMGL